jgi:hypothetical protein
MSARKLDQSVSLQAASGAIHSTGATLTGEVLRVHKNGVEFRTPDPLPVWREMSVDLQPSNGGRKVRCTGVVVACQGSRHHGYLVSMVLLNLTKQSQAQLSLLADARAV